MHRLHPGDRDRVAFLDEVCAQSLSAGHLRGPGIALAEEAERGMDGEVRRRDVIEVIPGDREGDRHAWADARAVGGDHGGAADPRGVHEHLAAADPP